MAEISIGNQKITFAGSQPVKIQPGTGYFKTSWNRVQITPEMAEVKITKKGSGIAWKHYTGSILRTSMKLPLQGHLYN